MQLVSSFLAPIFSAASMPRLKYSMLRSWKPPSGAFMV